MSTILMSTMTISIEHPPQEMIDAGVEQPEDHALLVAKARNADGEYFTAAAFVPFSVDLSEYTQALLKDLHTQSERPLLT